MLQLSSHGGMVLSWWLPCSLLALMCARCLYCCVVVCWVCIAYAIPFWGKCVALEDEDDICICGELCISNNNGHVRGDGWHEWVCWKLVIRRVVNKGVWFGVHKRIGCFQVYFLVVWWCIYWGAMHFRWKSLVGELVGWLVRGSLSVFM
jgi:hypothetical protein